MKVATMPHSERWQIRRPVCEDICPRDTGRAGVPESGVCSREVLALGMGSGRLLSVACWSEESQACINWGLKMVSSLRMAPTFVQVFGFYITQPYIMI